MDKFSNHPYFPSISSQGLSNSGITALDHAALEILKEIVLDYPVDRADECARDAFIFAKAYMSEKESIRVKYVR